MKRAASEMGAEPAPAKKMISDEEMLRQAKEMRAYQEKMDAEVVKDFPAFPTWSTNPSRLFSCNNNGYPELYVMVGEGQTLKRAPALFKFPPGKPRFTTIEGIGSIPKMKDHYEFGLTIMPSHIGSQKTIAVKQYNENNEIVYDKDKKPVMEVMDISVMWTKTKELIDVMRNVMCTEVARNKYPNLNKLKEKCKAEILASNPRIQVDGEEYICLMIETLKKKMFSPFELVTKYTENNQSVDGIINRWSYKFKLNTFRPLYKNELGKSFEALYEDCPELFLILNTADRNSEAYEMATKIVNAYKFATKDPNGESTIKKLNLVSVERKDPITQKDPHTGNLVDVKDAQGKKIRALKEFSLFERRVTNRDIVQVQAYLGAWFVGDGLGLKNNLSCVFIIRHEPHVQTSKREMDADFDGYQDDEEGDNKNGPQELPPMSNQNGHPDQSDDFF